LALDLAARLGRPVAFLSGGEEIDSEDLIGGRLGETTCEVRDRYVQRVVRTESRRRAQWSDSVLSEAMERGHTLVYDEFTRSRPEANNVLLSALEERLITFADPARDRRYLHAHPEFRVILTSNPGEYAGVAAAPDALIDRMVTFDLAWCSQETETGIVARRSGLPLRDAAVVVGLVRALRDRSGARNPPSIRTALMIGRLLAAQGARATARDVNFVQICLDVLEARAPGDDPASRATFRDDLRRRIVAAAAEDDAA
jgi:gas vesicle protein GvpN